MYPQNLLNQLILLLLLTLPEDRGEPQTANNFFAPFKLPWVVSDFTTFWAVNKWIQILPSSTSGIFIQMCMCGLLGLILCSFGCFVTDGFISILFPEQQDKVNFSTTANVNPKFSLSLSLPDNNLYKPVKRGRFANRVDYHLLTIESSEFSLIGPIFHRGFDKSDHIAHVLLPFFGGHHFSCP